jgi:hypothetical protein
VWITWPGQRNAPIFASPAEAGTLTLLTNKNIPYETLLQGRDFGYGEPTRTAAFCWAFCLIAGGTGILWRMRKHVAAKSELQPLVD